MTMDNEDGIIVITKLKCLECGEECDTVEETFDYSGTHCTGGRAGIHHTGVYVSDCCLADYEDVL